jgi:hypothetical protein
LSLILFVLALSMHEASHSAIKKKAAKAGAWEDAVERCYPGTPTKLNVQCERVSPEKGVQGKAAKRCM